MCPCPLKFVYAHC
jgi:hypothetical protein